MGAINATTEWLKASNQGRKTLDPGPMLELSDPGCKTCTYAANDLRNMKASGGSFGGDYMEDPIGSRAEPDMTPAKVTVHVRTGDWWSVRKKGGKPERVKASTYDLVFDMKYVEGKWIVAQVTAITD